MKNETFKAGDFVSFTVPKNRWEAKQHRRGNIKGIKGGIAIVDCSGDLFTVPVAKLTREKSS